jgi:hypothetical protein
MKTKINVIMAISSLLIFLTTSCGGGMKTTKNEFLGEIPSIQKYYSAKVQEKSKELKACTDMNKAFKLDKEEQNLEQEWETKISDCMKANPLTAAIPFEQPKDQLYPVTRINVSVVNRHGFQIKLAIKFDKDIKFEFKDFCLYYVGVGKDGKDIPSSKLRSFINQGQTNDIKAGTETETTGCWTHTALSDMEDFAKIRFVSKDEYDKM